MNRALTGADIFDGKQLHEGKAFLLDGDVFCGIVPAESVPAAFGIEELSGGTILPGFVDLQANGGGGVMFNDETSVDGLRAIAQAHATTGTRALLPTLITDTPSRTRAAVEAVEAAIEHKMPGIIGIHLEGPHLSVARKGAHDPELIRPMTDSDEAFLVETAKRLANVMLTVAPENVTCNQIARLSEAGVIVSLGHTDCTMTEAEAAFEAGARCVTHLFNAMSQMGNREPGLVGAALNTSTISAGMIADDIHVHQASMRVALSSKQGPGNIFLVTDAMSTVGSDITELKLNGRRILRQNGQLTLEDGTLAGADLELSHALSILVENMGIPKERAFAMATLFPAQVLPQPGTAGRFVVGSAANAILLDDSLRYIRGL
ncbi:N-acetylglucosamine-6-phosphate deacetylase [uncultured Roseobacter sp.]|uniref:N-acetylglucosamine-6-phosphate deacetylase n=1 Tax=uncultured Roseobacter sp. TaxID=114847 RepID=UPI00260EE0E5|nr:N-acetylglucosamine-6-phosphate deacetylase [uncultured Roseobacter sp.]